MENEEACRLTGDFIVEILIRLPVKSLLRFKLVCKIWYYLIKSPCFVKLHLQYSSVRNNCILDMSRGEDGTDWTCYPDISLCFRSHDSFDLIDERPIAMEIPEFSGCINFVCGICDGLLCISDYCLDTLIWNPAIREYKKLPLPPFVSTEGCHVYLLAVGFGFDPVMNDYKVVVFSGYDLHGTYRDIVDWPSNVEIYNLSTNSWRHIGQIYTVTMLPGYSYGCPAKGALHWLAINDIEPRSFIISFNLSTEIVDYIELPDDPLVKIGNPMGLYITEFNESLALFSFDRNVGNVWVMLEYGVVKSWTKRFNIVTMRPPFMLRKNESNLMVKGQQVSCGVETSEVTANEAHGFHLIPGFVIYHESLVSC